MDTETGTRIYWQEMIPTFAGAVVAETKQVKTQGLGWHQRRHFLIKLTGFFARPQLFMSPMNAALLNVYRRQGTLIFFGLHQTVRIQTVPGVGLYSR